MARSRGQGPEAGTESRGKGTERLARVGCAAYNGPMIRKVASLAVVLLVATTASGALADSLPGAESGGGSSWSLGAPAGRRTNGGERGASLRQLLGAGANSLADLELRSELDDLHGVDREQALYRMGLARERLGDYAGAAEAFSRVPQESAWFPRAAQHLAQLWIAEGRYDRAAAAYRALVPTLAGVAAQRAHLALADALYAGGRYQDALAQYHLLENEPDPAIQQAAWYGEGWSALKAGLQARAYFAWSQILDLFPNSPRILEARLNLANHFLGIGHFDEAADQIRAVAAMPGMNQATASFHFGPAALADRQELVQMDLPALADFVAAEGAANDGDWVRAIAHYRAVPRNSRWAEQAAYGLGWVLWQAGRLPDAEDQLQDTLRAFPHGTLRAATYFALGRVQVDRNEKPDAKDSFRSATELGKDRWAEESLYELASLALADRRMDAAEKWARELERDYPTGHYAAAGLWVLAEAELSAGDTRDAIANYGRLAHHPEALDFLGGNDNPVIFKLGIAYLRAGDARSAESALSQVHGKLADEAVFWRAEALYDLGRYAEAANLYATYLKRGDQAPYAPEAAYGLAWSLLERGDRKGARKEFAQAAGALLEPKLEHDAYYRLSLLDMDDGDYAGAQAALQKALAIKGLAPDDEARFLLAVSEMRTGDAKDAADEFAAIVAKDPNSPRGRQAQRDLADCDMQLGDFLGAGNLYQTLAQSEPATASDVDDLRLEAATAYAAGGHDGRAANLYDLVATDASASAKVRIGALKPLVTAYIASGGLAQAESVLTDQASASAWAPEMLRQVADAYAKLREWRRAAAAYAEIPGGGTGALILRAQALTQAGELPDAAALFETLSASASARQPEILTDLAALYDQMGALKRARRTLGRLEAAPGAERRRKAQAWYAYGDVAFKKGSIPEAIYAFGKAQAEASPADPLEFKSRYWLGSALVEAGQPRKALAVLAKLIYARPPVDPEVASAWKSWRSLALLEAGEAHEHLHQWAEARAVYQRMTHDPLVADRDRGEAEARLAFIQQNVPASLLRERQ